mgnify:CR=1 FL=1
MIEANKVFAAVHTQVTGELMQLMNGFYHNIEDGLFEIAYTNQDQTQQRHLVELMRELRFRRKQLLRTFGKRVHNSSPAWLSPFEVGPELIEERMIANEMAAKCGAHFGPVLQTIAERTSHATARDVHRKDLPISPEAVSYHFVMSCRSVKFDKYSVATVQGLFQRFVLDRLGALYGRVNFELEEGGYRTAAETVDTAMLSSA